MEFQSLLTLIRTEIEHYRKWEIIFSHPLTDLSTSKRRHAVIVSKVNEDKDDVIVAFISSKIPTEDSETDYIINEDHPDFLDTGLFKKSCFKMDKLLTIEKSLFTGEIGEVSYRIMK